MFDRLFRRRGAPLSGAPAVRRLKTYSAQSGYVYQYFYEGQRHYERAADGGAEFVFSVSADRKTSQPVSVFVSDAAILSWETGHGRELSSTERYAIAKMALFQAFDERPTPAHMKEEVRLRPADVDAILEMLNLD
jgi:hypothetical protein